jgi:ribonuclease HII
MAVFVGVDENGLGPRLGPLVVTAVRAKGALEGAARALRAARCGRMAERLGDSKGLVSYADSSLGEAWARALVARRGLAPKTPDDLLRALYLEPEEELRAPCPAEHAGQCWSAAEERFLATDDVVRAVSADLARLDERGLVVEDARVSVTCVRRLNEATARGTSRARVDLHAMERLVLWARESGGEDVLATCGKVGGYDRYAGDFGPLSGRLHATLEEGRARSAYRVAGVGEIAFVRDADASHALVALASLVGKWARDVLMARIVRYHRAHDAALPDASGYHDPVTERFVEASRLSRRARGVPDACFERVRSGGARTAASHPSSTASTSSPAPGARRRSP